MPDNEKWFGLEIYKNPSPFKSLEKTERWCNV